MTSQETLLRQLQASQQRDASPEDVRRAVLAGRRWLIAHPGDVTVGLELRRLLDHYQPERARR